MIPIPAMMMCENDSLARCGFNEFWDRSMTAVKSGKLEKHRKDYLFNKKKEKEEKKKKPNVSMKIPHTLLRACTGVDLTVLSEFVHKRGSGLHSYFRVPHFCRTVWSPSLDTARPTYAAQKWAQVLFFFFLAACVGLLWCQRLHLSRPSVSSPPYPATKNKARSSLHKKESAFFSPLC